MKKFSSFLVVVLCSFSFSANAQHFKKLIPQKYDPAKESVAETFEHLALNGQIARTRSERNVIAKGDSVRIKVVFMPEDVVKIVAENGATATREDIKRGEWMVTFKPEKTKWCSIQRYRYDGTISEMGKVIVVVDPDKYDEVVARMNKLKGPELSKFMDSVAGKRFDDLLPISKFGKRWK